jgi:hypothetical protein
MKTSRISLVLAVCASMAGFSALAQIPYPNSHTIIPNSDAQVLTANGGDLTVTYFNGITGGDHDVLYLNGTEIFDNKINSTGNTVDLGSFTAGTVLNFTMTDFGNGGSVPDTHTWMMGSGVNNSDGNVHAYVTSDGVDGDGNPVTYVGWEDETTGQPYVDWNYNDLTFTFDNASPAVVPEPGTMALAGLGAASLLIFRRRK